MESSHLLLLLVLLSAILWILYGLGHLLRGAFQPAAPEYECPSIAQDKAAVLWQEVQIDASRRAMVESFLRGWAALGATIMDFASGLLRRRHERPRSERGSQKGLIADPIDGTPFQIGEAMLRCPCGTTYHEDSWRWLLDNNAGRCVKCKDAGPPFRIVA